MAALDSSNSSIGHGRFPLRTSDDRKVSRLPKERIDFSGECRRKVSRIHRQDGPDNTLGILVQNVRREKGFERTYSILEGLGAGWINSFTVKKVYRDSLLAI